jgi:hypothetical protein
LNRIIGRATALVTLLTLALVVAGPVAGASPDGVQLDGSATVTVVEAGTGAPVAGAEVMVRAYRTDFPEDPDLALLTGTTDAAGEVGFVGLPYAEAGAPPVRLDIDAYREVESTDEQGCVVLEMWHGFVEGLTASAGASIEVVAARATSGAVCHPLAGSILDASGQPVPAAYAYLSIELPDGGGAEGFPLQVGDDGRFVQMLPDWGTHEDPAFVTLEFLSAPTRAEDDDDCVVSFAERAAWSAPVALADGEELPFLEIVTAEVEIGRTCGSSGGGGGGGDVPPGGQAPGGGASPSLPPTDTARATSASQPAASTSPFGASGLVVAVGLLLIVTAGALQLSARRGN